MINPKEIWKIIDGFSNYEISSFGRVRAINPRKGSRANIRQGILKPWVRNSKSGKPCKLMIGLRANNKTFTFSVHHLVLVNFIGPRPKNKEGCHNDGNIFNNHLYNLRWDTHKANIHDCIKHGTKCKPPIHLGESHPKATLSDIDIAAIRKTTIVRGVKTKLAKEYKTSVTTITRILDYKTRI